MQRNGRANEVLYVYDPYGKVTVLNASWVAQTGSAYAWQYLFQGGRFDADAAGTINAISPAVIATPILEGIPQTTVDYMVSRIALGRTGKPEEVAALVHYLASAEASFCTGQCYEISGGRATY